MSDGRLIVYKMSVYKSQKRTLSPQPASDEEIDVGGNNVHPSHPYYYAYLEDTYDYEGPLDMSIKRRSPSPPSQTPTPPSIPTCLSQPPVAPYPHTPPPLLQPGTATTTPPPPYTWSSRGRPTVITCANPWYLPPPPNSHILPPPPPYDIAAAHLRETQKCDVISENAPTIPVSVSLSKEERRTVKTVEDYSEASRRQVVEAGPVDPEIDEHFRRSLGRNYHKLFLHGSTSDFQHQSYDSVDDHFAKALGPTWTKLKAGEKEPPRPLGLTPVSCLPPKDPSYELSSLEIPLKVSSISGVPSGQRHGLSPSQGFRSTQIESPPVATVQNFKNCNNSNVIPSPINETL